MNTNPLVSFVANLTVSFAGPCPSMAPQSRTLTFAPTKGLLPQALKTHLLFIEVKTQLYSPFTFSSPGTFSLLVLGLCHPVFGLIVVKRFARVLPFRSSGHSTNPVC